MRAEKRDRQNVGVCFGIGRDWECLSAFECDNKNRNVIIRSIEKIWVGWFLLVGF